MHLRVKTVLFLTLTVALVAYAATPRMPRRIGSRAARPIEQPSPPGSDQNIDTLSYYDPGSIECFWTLPNNWGDRYYNVRFTPPFTPFGVVEAHIPLFNVFGEQGTPGMRVIIWQSGSIDDEPGYPVGGAIDSVDVPFDSLVFGENEVEYNVIDLRPLEITFYGRVDFHIGVDLIADSTNDTLAVYSDDGELIHNDRSLLWDGQDGEWAKFRDLFPVTPYNLVIRAVITDQVGVPTVLDPAATPDVVLIDPAWPNPFNRRVRIRYSVMPGVPFTASLFDQYGRRVESITSGVGSGEEELMLDGTRLTTGAYYLHVNAGRMTAVQRLVYIK